jgi:hypothetical protein
MAKVERKARQSAVLWTQIAAATALSQDGTNTAHCTIRPCSLSSGPVDGLHYLPSGIRTPTQASRIC